LLSKIYHERDIVHLRVLEDVACLICNVGRQRAADYFKRRLSREALAVSFAAETLVGIASPFRSTRRSVHLANLPKEADG
jgi:hypothetical protein